MIKVLRNQTGISVHTIWIGATLSLLILLVSLPSALADSSGTPIPGNLVVNGSFEDNPSLNQGPNAPQEVLFSSGPNPMPGWTQLNTICQDGQDNPTEFWGHGAIRTAQDGHWLLELDTRRNVIIQQSVPTVAGQQYGLRYYFAARPSTSLATNALRVRVNGVQVNFVTAINSDCSTCRQFSHVITATGSTTTLRFEGAGTIDGLGSLLDNVSLVLVPDSDGDGVQDTRDICPGTVIPESIPTTGKLGVNRWALTDGDGNFDTAAPKGKGPQRSYTIDDTGGCSGEQIADALELGKGHYRFGLSIGAMDEWINQQQPES